MREFHMRILYQNEGFFMLFKKIGNSMILKEISIPKILILIYKGISSKIQRENVIIWLFVFNASKLIEIANKMGIDQFVCSMQFF